MMPGRRRSRFLLSLAVLLLASGTSAQQPEAESYTLRRAVEEAWRRFPGITAASAAVSAATSEREVARDAYLPAASLHMQLSHATRNNILGTLLPNQTLPPVTGLAPDGPSARGVWGSATGLLLSWTAYDFGTRRARLEVADAGRTETEARLELVRYQLADRVADAWFRAIAAERAERAAAASVTRWRTSLEAANALVAAGLKPGADASRLRAELVRTEAEQLVASERARAAVVDVARFMGNPEKPITLESEWVMQPYSGAEQAGSTNTHPLLTLRSASVAVFARHAALAQREWLPRIDLYSSVSGRGTGARNNGDFRDGAAGLYPDTGNWAVGVAMTVDLFDWKRFRSRKEVRDHRVEEARAYESEASLELRSLIEQARIRLATARAIAAKVPEALLAASELLTQSEVRYRTGLGTITELAEAQRTLQQAEVEDALARIQVWRAAAGLAAARGDLEAFLAKTP